MKVTLTAEQKAALQVKRDAIVKVKAENKVLKTTIKTNAEAAKVELKRIEDSKIVLDPAVQAEIDSVFSALKTQTTHIDKDNKKCVDMPKTDAIKSVVTPISTDVTPISTVVTPVVPEKTYIEKLNERLDNVAKQYADKNAQLTALSNRLILLLNTLKGIA